MMVTGCRACWKLGDERPAIVLPSTVQKNEPNRIEVFCGPSQQYALLLAVYRDIA